MLNQTAFFVVLKKFAFALFSLSNVYFLGRPSQLERVSLRAQTALREVVALRYQHHHSLGKSQALNKNL